MAVGDPDITVVPDMRDYSLNVWWPADEGEMHEHWGVRHIHTIGQHPHVHQRWPVRDGEAPCLADEAYRDD